MVSLRAVGLSSLLYAIAVAAGGVFPPVPPGVLGPCGPLPTDALCSTVFTACNKTLTDPNDPFNNEACVAAASCYPGTPMDFVTGISCYQLGRPGAGLNSTLNLPRVSNAVYNDIAVNGVVTESSYQNWMTSVAIAADPGVKPLIDVALIVINWDIIAGWTGFCSTGNIPQHNFLDWFQYSSTIEGATSTCYSLGNCPLSDYPFNTDLLIPCSKYQNALTDPFSIEVCVAAALNWYTGVDSFLAAITCRYNLEHSTNYTIPASTSLPSLSVDIATSSPYTQQNFIDFTYGALSPLQASVRWPTSISWVTKQWAGIVKWTNFCGASVPKKNLSDFLLYSHFRIAEVCYAVCGTDPNPGCQSLLGLCTERSTYLSPWHERTCVLAATCYTGGVKTFAIDYSCQEETSGSDTLPINFPRLEQSVWDTLDNSSTGLTGLQDYINDVTGALNGATDVPTAEYLTNKWEIIRNWTGFPSGNVPFSNFADWLQYS